MKRFRRITEGRRKLREEDRLLTGLESIVLPLLAMKASATSYEIWKEYKTMLFEQYVDEIASRLSPTREAVHEALIRLRNEGYVTSCECMWRKRVVSRFRLTEKGVKVVLEDMRADYITNLVVAGHKAHGDRPALPSGRPRLIGKREGPLLKEGRTWPLIETANFEILKSLVNNYFVDVIHAIGLDLLLTEDEIAQLAKLSEDFRALLIFELFLCTTTYPGMPVTSVLLGPLVLKQSEDKKLSPFERSLISSMTEEDEELLAQLAKSTLTRIRAQLERLLKVLDEQEKLLANLTKRKRASQER